MGKDSKQHEDDILNEKYKGPNEVIVVAGGAYYAHYWMALAGTAAGAAVAIIFPKHSSQAIQKLRTVAESWINDSHKLKKWAGKAIHQIFGTGADFEEYSVAKKGFNGLRSGFDKSNSILEGMDKHLVYQEKGFGFWLFDHTFGLIPPIKRWVKDATNFTHKAGDEKDKAELVSNAITSGGLLGMFGFTVVPWVYSFFEGSRSVDRGKKQFQRAQNEVRELREDLNFMEKRNEDLRNELRTVRDEPIRVTRDEPPVIANDMNDPTTSQEVVSVPKRKDDHALEPTTSHSERHAAAAGKPHSERVLAKADAEHVALGA